MRVPFFAELGAPVARNQMERIGETEIFETRPARLLFELVEHNDTVVEDHLDLCQGIVADNDDVGFHPDFDRTRPLFYSKAPGRHRRQGVQDFHRRESGIMHVDGFVSHREIPIQIGWIGTGGDGNVQSVSLQQQLVLERTSRF